MNTIPRKLRHFGAPLLIMLSAATLGWFVQAIGVVAVVFIVVLVKRFGKFEAQLAASTFTVVSALFALAPHSQFKVDGGFLETAPCIACVWITIAIASNRDSAEEAIRRSERERPGAISNGILRLFASCLRVCHYSSERLVQFVRDR